MIAYIDEGPICKTSVPTATSQHALQIDGIHTSVYTVMTHKTRIFTERNINSVLYASQETDTKSTNTIICTSEDHRCHEQYSLW
jgi:hypothetical protein